MVNEKRGKFEIIYDFLKSIHEKSECNKTEAMRSARLDWRVLDKYYSFLKNHEVIKNRKQKNSEIIRLTKKGEILLKELEDLKELLNNASKEGFNCHRLN